MAHLFLRTVTLVLGACMAIASPVHLATRAGAFSTLSTADVDRFKPFTFFASAAYCPSDKTKGWTCGALCDANPNFQPTATGGDGDDIPFWFVGFDPDLSSVVVAHQGTDPHKIQSLLTDAEVVPENLDANLFPGISSNIKVHSGFRDAQAKTAQDVLAAVQKTMQDHGTNKVTTVGHSLGGALSLLDAVFLPLHIPGVQLEMISYGQPRVGDSDFANFVDANVKLTRITNQKDLVPILPGRFLGFRHASSEVHIQSDGSFVSCPGQDNDDPRCSTGDAKNIFEAKVDDHFGPYGGIKLDTSCPPS